MSDVLRILERYQNRNIAIYGLGIETQKLLEELGGRFRIVGLLDSYKQEGVIYGRRIISFAEAVHSHVTLILVVARPGSCKMIAGKIKEDCIKNGIDLLDVRGSNLCEEKKEAYDFVSVSGITRDELTKRIYEKEVISIDLFDTLVMRHTLFITDLFELVDLRLRQKGIEIADFARKRLGCEKELSVSHTPTLKEIYTKLAAENNVQEISPDDLVTLEWEIDCEQLVPRQEMCDLMREIQGAVIYIVTDMYYSKKQIERILQNTGIDFYTELLVSCEYGTGKQQGLFEILKEKLNGKSCLHIGDDRTADIESAKRHGLEACQVYSGIDLFEAVGYFGIWDDMKTLSDRLKAGMFVAKLFNSPFQFETQDRKIGITRARDIGFLLAAPMIADFTLWFRQQVRKFDLQNIWFCARDGYLIQRLYERLTGDFTSIYFLISRTAAIRAGIRDEDDIRYVEGMNFSGSLREQMQERFGIQLNDEQEGSIRNKTLSDYTDEILDWTKEYKKNYLQYIARLSVDNGSVALFDFVAKGTSQMFLGHIVPNHLKGLYFLQLEKENMEDKGLDIVSFYDAEDLKNSAIYEDYYIIETILTSDMPSLAAFDERGQAVYAKETRTVDEIRCVREIQEGIADYFATYLNLHAGEEPVINRKIDEKFLRLIHHLYICENRFTQMKVEDCFVNRFTDLSSLF